MNKFELDQKVIIKATGKLAEVKHYKYEKQKHNGKILESHKYYLQIIGGYSNWYNESEIRPDAYTFERKYDIELLNLMIDINLTEGNYEMVKYYNEQKQQLKRGAI